jgi:CheY-like chemotaxis protein
MRSVRDIPVEISNLAEGRPDDYEIDEPANPLKTTTVPAIKPILHDEPATAETGVVSSIEVKSEGRDNGDIQDAFRTTEETRTVVVSQKESVIEANKAPLVLIVEDTMELAEVIQATLERMDMKTVHETHGTKALTKMEELNPDVVLLDISLPDITGWKILDVIRERAVETGSQPIVIVITAYGDPANRLVGKLQGVHSYLIKPFTSDEIEKLVTQALNSPAG